MKAFWSLVKGWACRNELPLEICAFRFLGATGSEASDSELESLSSSDVSCSSTEKSSKLLNSLVFGEELFLVAASLYMIGSESVLSDS